jgi:hypothetical protein
MRRGPPNGSAGRNAIGISGFAEWKAAGER